MRSSMVDLKFTKQTQRLTQKPLYSMKPESLSHTSTFRENLELLSSISLPTTQMCVACYIDVTYHLTQKSAQATHGESLLMVGDSFMSKSHFWKALPRNFKFPQTRSHAPESGRLHSQNCHHPICGTGNRSNTTSAG